MRKQILVLRFKDKDYDYRFEDKVFVIEDSRLIEGLSKPNIKNQESPLVIKSLNDTHISDVIQVRINVGDTGHFLASFKKESFSEEKRKNLLEDIGKLKNRAVPTYVTQTKKITELIGILNKYRPLYVTFSNTGDIKIKSSKFSDYTLKFPLLILTQPEKKPVLKIGKPNPVPKPKQNGKPVKAKKKSLYEAFPLFDVDYLFAFIFAMLGSFAITASAFELMNEEKIATFLIILACVFAITLVIAIQSTLYKKGVVRNPLLRYYLGLFVLLGITAGIVAGYYICRDVLKTEIEDFDYKKMLTTSSIISVAALLSSITTCRLVNLVVKYRLNKKK